MVVVAESATRATGCELSAEESWATTTVAGASNVPKSTQVVAIIVFMIFALGG
jgi:hypothetical protein